MQDFAAALDTAQHGGAAHPELDERPSRARRRASREERPQQPFGEPKSPREPRRISRRTLIASLAAAAVLAASAAVGAAVLTPPDASASGPGIAAAVPADADTVIVAKPTPEWWTILSKFSPQDFQLGSVDPFKADLSMASIGYSRSPKPAEASVPMTGPTRTFYVEATDDAAAGKVESFLKGKLASANARVYRSGKFVTVNQSWIPSFALPAQPVTSAPGYTSPGYGPGATMWLSYANMPASLAGADDTSRKDLLASYFQKAFGLKSDTAWSGTSSTGIDWTGKFTRGGFDTSLLDMDGIASALQKTQDTLAEGSMPSQPGVTEHYTLRSTGMFGLIQSAGFYRDDTQRVSGEDPRGGSFRPLVGEKLAASVVVPSWTASATGTTSFTEGVAGLKYSIGDGGMNVSVDYASQR